MLIAGIMEFIAEVREKPGLLLLQVFRDMMGEG